MAEDDYNFDDFLGDEETSKTQDNSNTTEEKVSEKTENLTKEKTKKISVHTYDEFLGRKNVKNETEAFHMNPKDAEVILAVVFVSRHDKTQGALMSYLLNVFIKEKGE